MHCLLGIGSERQEKPIERANSDYKACIWIRQIENQSVLSSMRASLNNQRCVVTPARRLDDSRQLH